MIISCQPLHVLFTYYLLDANQPYTVFQQVGDGLGVMTIYNSTHILFEHHIS